MALAADVRPAGGGLTDGHCLRSRASVKLLRASGEGRRGEQSRRYRSQPAGDTFVTNSPHHGSFLGWVFAK